MKKNKLHIFFLILIVISFGIIGYFGYQNYLLKKNKLFLESELSQTKADFASTKKDLEAVIASTQKELTQTNIELDQTKTERDDFELKYSEEKSRMDYFAS